MTKRTGAVARKLADELRARDDDALAALLRARPDLLSPLPTDITNLVARANTYASILRALEQFDAFTLQVVDALVYLPDPATFDAVHLLLRPAEPADVRAALERLRECALLWGDEQAPHLVRTVRDVVAPESASRGMRLRTALGGYPPARLRDLMEDLGLPAATDPVSAAAAIAELVADQQRFADLIAAAPPQAKELLDSLSEGPSWGQVANANRPVRTATAESPLEWLLARGLLVALDRDTVVLPAEVAVAVRGGRLHTAVTAVPPALDATPHNAEDVDRTAAGQAYAAITRVEELLDAWALDPPAMLRAGGLGVRELRRAAALIDADEPTAALLIETAFAAGLVAPNGEPDELVLPTPEYDAWRAMDPAARWAALAHAWVEMPRLPSLVGTRDERDRPLAALAPEVIRTLAPPLRRAALNELAELEPGTAVTPDSLLRRLTWLRPRHNPRLREEVLPAALGEAEILGVTGRGALASYARPLVIPTAPEGDDDRERASAHAMAPLLPRPIDHVFIQADLTAIAPGPLVRGLAAQLAVAADVESTGGATVYRFTERSIRRALDMGRTAAELHELLRRHSRTPVPQPLSYLIDDVARRHGRIRIGTAAAYVRCDDEAVLTELLADRRAARLGLRRLAPTVLVSDSSGASLLEGLRAMGYAPAEESAEGAVIVRRPEARRSAPRSRPAQLRSWAMQAPTDTLVRRAVQVLRAGDRAANRTTDRAAYWSSDPAAHWNSNPVRDPARDRAVYQAAFRRLLQPDSTAELLDRLQQAVQTEAALQIGYVDDYGAVSEHEVHPLLVQGGYLTAYNRAQQRIETFAIHRIVDVDPPDLPE